MLIFFFSRNKGNGLPCVHFYTHVYAALYYTPIEPRFYGFVENNALNGILTFAGAFYENLVPGYYVLFGSGPHAFERIGKTNTQKFFDFKALC
jgi:hypothetical protein